MLRYFSVKHFAILENIEVQFENGFTVLTGETGAGKSLLIDAIGLLLGDRASSSVVQTGADFCEVQGLFVRLNDAVKTVLKSLDIPVEDDEVLIKRQVSPTSGNVIKINNQTVTLQDLRSVTQFLADIHTQHDTKRLINPDTYLALIDHYTPEIKSGLTTYQKKRQIYLEALNDYQNTRAEKDHIQEKTDLMRYQIDEIEKHHIQPGEESAIEERLTVLQNFDKIFQTVKSSTETLKDHNHLEALYDTAQNLKNLKGYNDVYATLSERIESAYFELDDIKDTLSDTMHTLDFDPDELERLETRKHTFETLKRKYHMDIEAFIHHAEALKKKLKDYDDVESLLADKHAHLKTCFEAVKAEGERLSTLRKQSAKAIEVNLIDVLKTLELKQTRFKINFETPVYKDVEAPSVFLETGTDRVDFYLSTNPGEPLKPLSKVASGGELSRIMLALKEILVRNMSVTLMIFDEIDTGVSGYIASQVALKMKAIATKSQVISITHLPQVAAKADQHYNIYKESTKTRTKAYIEPLDKQGRIRAIAAMISSDKITPSALSSAEELLK